jgi:hypothetical protein
MGRQNQGVEAEEEVHRPIQDLPAHVFGLEKEKHEKGEKKELRDPPQVNPAAVRMRFGFHGFLRFY